nr:uncharacterized protein LOC112586910 [Bubalus bubalis]
MSQESCKAEPRVLSSPRLLEEDSPEPPSQQLQATSSGGSESLGNLDLSHGPLVALEYLPFFRTYGQLLAEEELAPRPEVFRDQGGDQSVREEDSELPSGFFPYYRSKEESFPSLALPGRSRAGSRGPPIRREAQACRCCTRTISGDGSLPALWSNVCLPSPCLPGPRGHVVWCPNSRFTPCTAAEGPEAEAGGCLHLLPTLPDDGEVEEDGKESSHSYFRYMQEFLLKKGFICVVFYDFPLGWETWVWECDG